MTEFSQTFVISGDRVKCLYPVNDNEEKFDVTLGGRIVHAEKLSDVKFDTESQEWIAIDRKTQKIIARDPSRVRCVEKEHAYYEEELAKGRPPWE